MGRRRANLAFMPGKYVFPGGRVDPGDWRVPVAEPYSHHVAERLAVRTRRPTQGRLNAFGVAAIRECAEETGLMLGSPARAPIPSGGVWRDFATAGIIPSLGGLTFVARAITPVGYARRFDTRFFLADASGVAGRAPEGSDPELLDLSWVTWEVARTLDMPAITGSVLAIAEERLGLGLGFDRPAPFFNGDDVSPKLML